MNENRIGLAAIYGVQCINPGLEYGDKDYCYIGSTQHDFLTPEEAVTARKVGHFSNSSKKDCGVHASKKFVENGFENYKFDFICSVPRGADEDCVSYKKRYRIVEDDYMDAYDVVENGYNKKKNSDKVSRTKGDKEKNRASMVTCRIGNLKRKMEEDGYSAIDDISDLDHILRSRSICGFIVNRTKFGQAGTCTCKGHLIISFWYSESHGNWVAYLNRHGSHILLGSDKSNRHVIAYCIIMANKIDEGSPIPLIAPHFETCKKISKIDTDGLTIKEIAERTNVDYEDVRRHIRRGCCGSQNIKNGNEKRSDEICKKISQFQTYGLTVAEVSRLAEVTWKTVYDHAKRGCCGLNLIFGIPTIVRKKQIREVCKKISQFDIDGLTSIEVARLVDVDSQTVREHARRGCCCLNLINHRTGEPLTPQFYTLSPNKSRTKYDTRPICKTLSLLKTDGMTVAQVSEKSEVPKSTIRYHIEHCDCCPNIISYSDMECEKISKIETDGLTLADIAKLANVNVYTVRNHKERGCCGLQNIKNGHVKLYERTCKEIQKVGDIDGLTAKEVAKLANVSYSSIRSHAKRRCCGLNLANGSYKRICRKLLQIDTDGLTAKEVAALARVDAGSVHNHANRGCCCPNLISGLTGKPLTPQFYTLNSKD